MREVLPEAVVGSDDSKLAVNYNALMPLLIESIKELHDKVATTKLGVSQLRQRSELVVFFFLLFFFLLLLLGVYFFFFFFFFHKLVVFVLIRRFTVAGNGAGPTDAAVFRTSGDGIWERDTFWYTNAESR